MMAGDGGGCTGGVISIGRRFSTDLVSGSDFLYITAALGKGEGSSFYSSRLSFLSSL
jgi:hypothetical protein